MAELPIDVDRVGRKPLAAQIYAAIREAIEAGRLASGARLPSWRDLAAQLGVSRGTVRVAYERLINEQFVIGMGGAGTRVAGRPSRSSAPDWSPEAPPLPELFYAFGAAPLAFQMGVPSQDAFPFKLWSRLLTRETRQAALAPIVYPDPRGEPDLRKEVAAYLGHSPRHSVHAIPGAYYGRFLQCARPRGPRSSSLKGRRPGWRIRVFHSRAPRSAWPA